MNPIGRPVGGCHSSPSLVLLWYGGAALPVQAAPQGGQDVLDGLLPPPGLGDLLSKYTLW